MAYFETTSGANFSDSQAITTTADSTNIFDITGAGAGNAPAMIGANGVNTAIGVDIGLGDGVATAQVFVNVEVNGTGAGTITFSILAAPDDGSYGDGTYQTIFASQAFVGTDLDAGDILVFPVPPIPPTLALPRFYKLAYTVAGSATVTVSAWMAINAPLPRNATLYGNNYTVAS